MADISDLVGKVLRSVTGGEYDDEMLFTTLDGITYKMYHAQDCCESVAVEDICGDLNDLLYSPILEAREYCNTPPEPNRYDSATWTFYHFTTMKGTVVIRWLGESNGYYSETVDFIRLGTY